MRKKKMGALLVLLSGSTLFGGCLGFGGGGLWNVLWQGAAVSAADSALDALLFDNLFLGQDVANGIAFSNAIFAACDGIEDAQDRATCLAGVTARP